MAVAPRSPYAANKVADEAMMAAYAASYAGLDTVCLRYFNIFGPRQSPDNAYAAVIAAFAKALVNGRRPVIFGDGEQSRDFTFVDNAVLANLLATKVAGPLGGAAVNVACGRRVTVNELAAGMAAAFGRPDLTPDYRPGPGRRRAALAGRPDAGPAGARVRAGRVVRRRAAGDGRVVSESFAAAGVAAPFQRTITGCTTCLHGCDPRTVFVCQSDASR